MAYTDWNIKTQDINCVNKLSSALSCNEIVSRLLINRGITNEEQAKQFLNPDNGEDYDPFLLGDMEKAVERIKQAVENQEKIFIYGDYDVDGITSVSVLYLYLKKFTSLVDYYIPDRFTQGYGMNDDAVNLIKKRGCGLIITVDTGISAFSEACTAKALGIDMIITDHHECQGQLPNVYAVVNPKMDNNTYPFEFLAGVGVVYKLISAMDIIMHTNYRDENIDLVAVGTIADIMPLLDENRKIVSAGLRKMSHLPNAGLKMLIDMCLNSTNITSGNVGFAIAPRINAAGRMESAQTAVRLFITDNVDEVKNVAEHLCELNTKRQQIENEIYNEAIEIIEKHELNSRFSVLVLWKEGWHNGVIGIVASKLKEKYNKPVVLFSVDSASKGSARSIAPFNIFEAFRSMEDIMIQYGGHKYAAGALIENEMIYEFRDRLCDYFDSSEDNHPVDKIDVECELPVKLLTLKTLCGISMLQPFGKLNEVPLFCIRNAKIAGVFPTASNRHIRLKLTIGDKSFTAFYFGVSPCEFDYREGDIVDIVCEMNENEYKSIKSVQLIIRDIRLSENLINNYSARRVFCDSFDDAILPSMLPSRDDIAVVYKYIHKCFCEGKKRFNIDNFSSVLCKDCLVSMNYEKIYFSLKILSDLEIISADIAEELLIIKDIPDGKKVSLYDSALLMNIYEKAGVKFGY